ncbi:MAG: recombinase family protein [Sporichthyaceae bacterium]
MTKRQLRTRRTAMAASAVIYLRVSTEEQAKSGAGLDAQEAECRAYAERNGMTVVEVIREEPVSGKVHPAKRTGYTRAMELLDACEAGTLLVRRLDRVSRRLRHTLDVVDAADAAGWTIATTDGKVDTATASGRLHLNMMATIAEFEREVTGERTKEALASLKASGVKLGAQVQISDEIADRIVSEHQDGRSMRAIAATLTAEGIPTAKGGAWSHATVQAVIRRVAS